MTARRKREKPDDVFARACGDGGNVKLTALNLLFQGGQESAEISRFETEYGGRPIPYVYVLPVTDC